MTMIHQDIAQFSTMARHHFGALEMGYDSRQSWKREMSALLGHRAATQIAEQKERQQAQQDIQLKYDYSNMTLNTKRSYRAELKDTLDVIEDRQPHLKLYHTKGELFWKYKTERHHLKEIDIYRLEAPDGYAMDFEHDIMTNEDGEKHNAIHVKFIMQSDVKQQGNGMRMQRHVTECSDVLFTQGATLLWGMASRLNQFSVRETRHGENWRAAKVKLKDAHGNLSKSMIRLLACYLRQNWVLLGEQKEGEELIAYLSPEAINKMVNKLGNEALEEFKYCKQYENIITNYKV